jgi:hypothetical protein
MAEEEGVGARAAWRLGDEHMSGGGGREVLAARRAGGGPECRGNYSVARWAGLGPVPRSGFSGLFLEKPVLIFVVGQRGSCGLKE